MDILKSRKTEAVERGEGEPKYGVWAHNPDEAQILEPKRAILKIEEFANEIGLKPDEQGRYKFGPEHVELAYEYAEAITRREKAEEVVVDGIASPSVIASLLHGAHPARGYVIYAQKKPDGTTSTTEVEILEPIPQGDGAGPEGFHWAVKEEDEYTLVEFFFDGSLEVGHLPKVVPPEINSTKPVIISGRGPTWLTQTVAAAYRHYRGVPAVGFYQPASKFGPARTEIGISHSPDIPLGLNFGEPAEIGLAKIEYEKEIASTLAELEANIKTHGLSGVEVSGKALILTTGGRTYSIYIKSASSVNR